MSQLSKGLNLQEIRVSMGMFTFDVLCVIGEYEDATKYTAKKFEYPYYEQFAIDSNKGFIPRGKCFFMSGYVPVIWIPQRPVTSREHATLAHECLHATMHLFSWASIPQSADTEEVMCHAMSHIYNKILEKSK